MADRINKLILIISYFCVFFQIQGMRIKASKEVPSLQDLCLEKLDLKENDPACLTELLPLKYFNNFFIKSVQNKCKFPFLMMSENNRLRPRTINADGTSGIFSNSDDRSIAFWNRVDGAVHMRELGICGADSLGISADGVLGVFVCKDIVKIHNITINWEIKTLRIPKCIAASVTPDGKKGIMGFEDDTIELWDILNAKKIKRLTSGCYNIYGVAISADGDEGIAVWDNYTTIWNLKNGKEIVRLRKQEDSVSMKINELGAIAGVSDSDITIFEKGAFVLDRLPIELLIKMYKKLYIKE